MIFGKPELKKDMGSKVFLEYYYLDKEMSAFCKENGLDSTGDRQALKDRIVIFLNGGKDTGPKFVPKVELDLSVISEDMPIERDFVFSTEHGTYFMEAIGPDFIPYQDFIIWLEENPGKTYGEAIDFWYLLHDDMS